MKVLKILTLPSFNKLFQNINRSFTVNANIILQVFKNGFILKNLKTQSTLPNGLIFSQLKEKRKS